MSGTHGGSPAGRMMGGTRFVPIQRKTSVEEMGDKIVQMLDEIEKRKTSVEEMGDKIVQMLDEIEKRVEHLRDSAQQMEYEKESLMEMLSTVNLNKDMIRLGQGDKEDIEATTDRLLARCRTVEVQVSTPRNPEQRKALTVIEAEIEGLVQKTKDDLTSTRSKAKTFLNACQPEQPDGPIDQKFQAVLIECTADDQKKIRRRLTNLLGLLDRTEKTVDAAYV